MNDTFTFIPAQSRIDEATLLAVQQQMAQLNNQAAVRMQELEREILAMRGQYERDQLLLEQYDRVSASGWYYFLFTNLPP